MNTTTRIPIVLMSVEETAQAVSISVKTVRSLIRQGRLRAVNFGTRMTRIYLQDLLEIAKGQGYQVVLPSSLSLEGATSKKAQPRLAQSTSWQSVARLPGLVKEHLME